MASKPKKRTQDRLQVIVCLSCNKMPANERDTLVKVSDGKRTQFIKFGRRVSLGRIMHQLPIVFMDRAYDERRSRKRA
ncbi:hypothetical protein D0469_03515 [Peribacillus saganii]|uniref:Uncharacterized protein n=1 Tax=Peribacillus saganii TaxID=2303992 RepID=A0A372LS47_9BACI|nr:hypothetical protein [Peribacillus saganii]RFU71021.1 hypothetical protein D0469_03515 [Peribacillus saganii]